MIPIVVKNRILQSVTYILPAGNGRVCWLVDCGDIEKIIAEGWHIRGVLLTHAHVDHIYGINILLKNFPDAIIYTNMEGLMGLQNPKWNLSYYHEVIDDFVISSPQRVCIIEKEGSISLDDFLTAEIYFTPGHEPSCISYRIDDFLFTGDSYIPGIKTTTAFPRGDKEKAKNSLLKIKELESSGLTVMSGHYI